jgi:F-type H+-transporting ATPase subunit a
MVNTVALAQSNQEHVREEILHEWTEAKESGLFGLPVIHLELAGIDLSISKITYFLFLGALVTFLVLFIGSRLLKARPNLFQVIIEELYRFGNGLGGQIGDRGKRYFPYTLTLFVFILTLNLIGLVPGSYPVTSNLSFTLTLALMTFITVQVVGFRSNGPVTYLKTWTPGGLPVPFILGPIMWVLHLIGEISKPLTLGLRLYANILAGHLVIFVFLSLILTFGAVSLAPVVALPLALVFYAFEIFVALLQAYIFAILTQLYIELAMYAEEAH